MAVTVIQRRVNKARVEQPLSVRYSYPDPITGKSKDYIVAVGVTVDPQYFCKGKVVDCDLAPEANEKINTVTIRLEKAVRNVVKMGKQPTVELVKQHFLTLPTLKSKIEKLQKDWSTDGKSKLEILERELTELLILVEDKQAEIVEVKKQLGVYQPELFSELTLNMLANKRVSYSTKQAYHQMLAEAKVFNPTLNIREVTRSTIEAFESHLIKREFLNGTIEQMTIKFKAVMNNYVEDYQLSKSYREYKFNLKKPEENVIYLNKKELEALAKAEFTHWNKEALRKMYEVRDLALLMAETGLRFVDSHITRKDIKNGMIVKRQQKTDGLVYIPFSKRLKSICEKYNYDLRGKEPNPWNHTLRRILEGLNLDSLKEKVITVNYSGNKEVIEEKMKWEFCSAHTFRRTMINQCLLKGRRYDQITKMTGHRDFTTFQTYIDRDSTELEQDQVFDYLDEEPTMKVVA